MSKGVPIAQRVYFCACAPSYKPKPLYWEGKLRYQLCRDLSCTSERVIDDY